MTRCTCLSHLCSLFLPVLLVLDCLGEALSLLSEFVRILLMLPVQFSVILIAHLVLMAGLNSHVLESVKSIARFLYLNIDLCQIITDSLALLMVLLICQISLRNLATIVDNLKKYITTDKLKNTKKLTTYLRVELC